MFPSVEYVRYMVSKARTVWAKDLLPTVIDCHHIQFMDFSAAQGIRDLFITFGSEGHLLILWRPKPSMIRILKGLLESNVPYLIATTEDELEQLIDGAGTTHSLK